MVGKNVNYGISGQIGDQFNIYQNILIIGPIFEESIKNGKGISSGKKYILTLELFNKYCEDLEKEIKKALSFNRYPLKIRVTKLVDDGAQGVYYNDGNINEDIWWIVDAVVSLTCMMCGVLEVFANRVYVGNHIYYELYPQI